MTSRSLLIAIFCICCASPALLVRRPAMFEHASVDEELGLTSVPAGAAESMIAVGDRVIGVDGAAVDSLDELQAAVTSAPRLVPVRILRGPPVVYAWDPGTEGEEVPRLIEQGMRVTGLGGNGVFERLSIGEAIVRAEEVAVDAGSIDVELANHENVVDGAFLRTYAGPNSSEMIAASVALALLSLSLWFLRHSRTRNVFAIGMMLAAVPYLMRYLLVWSDEWALYAAIALGSVGTLTVLWSLGTRRRSQQQRSGSSNGWMASRKSSITSATIDPINRVAYALQRLALHLGEDVLPEFVIGFNRRAVRIRRVSGRIHVELAEQPLHAGLSMLAIEGGVLPRTETIVGMTSIEPEDDPFTGLQQRLNILAAVPLSELGDGSREWGFAVVYRANATFADDDSEVATSPIPLADLLDDLRGPMLAAELKSLAADELLRELERAEISSEGVRGSRNSETRGGTRDQGRIAPPPPPRDVAVQNESRREPAKVVAARSDASQRAERRQRREADEDTFLQQLSEELQQDYPLADPSVLTPEQWVELDPLITDDARPYLIVGEPGVGKELRARLIHLHSPRARTRIAVVECSGAPEPVVGARLLGSQDSEGLIECVSGGTIILKSALQLGKVTRDEIVARCGARDVRLAFIERIAVEPRKLPASVPTSMRHVIGSRWLTVLPLHELPGETRRIAERLLHEFSLRYARQVLAFSSRSAEVLDQMEFAANLHELRGICLAAVLRADSDEIEVEALMNTAAGEVADVLAEVEAEEEKRQIVAALHRADGNKSEASRMLGMSRGTLLRRLKQYKLV